MKHLIRKPYTLILIGLILAFAVTAEAKPKARSAANKSKKVMTTTARQTASVQAPKRAPSQAPGRAQGLGSLANMDINRSLEVRGQARNLSMMLVLKNGKDSIDFVKVRKDYAPEIKGTEF